MNQTTSLKTVAVLRQTFATYGLPEQVVTDNGPQFTSAEFSTFLKSQGVKHIRSAPYHPASNGLAERFVQSLKHALKASKEDERSVDHRLQDYLLTYRSTPHATTGVTPASLFLNRTLRTKFDLLRPDTAARVVSKQAVQKEGHDMRARVRDFAVGQTVLARTLRPGPDWIPGRVVEKLGPVTYMVETINQRFWKRHANQLKETTEQAFHSATPESGGEVVLPDTPTVTAAPESHVTTGPETNLELTPPQPEMSAIPSSPSNLSHSHSCFTSDCSSSNTASSRHTPPRRYPNRIRHPPDRFQ